MIYITLQQCLQKSYNKVYFFTFSQTNDVFYDQFERWSAEWPGYVSVVNDKTCTNETRLGAVAAIEFAAKHFGLDEDVVILAG